MTSRRPPAVARVLERVTASARRHGMFLPGGPVLVACSGGPDSLCLLHALHRLRRLLRIDLACFHFDHALREGSGADAHYVRRQARALNVPFYLRRADTKPGRGESVEAWARTARYAALSRVVEEAQAQAAAVGHTADDQAETVLLALLRGGGLEALAGMEPVSRPVVRPLLEVTRDETVAFCRALRLRPRRDPMNEERGYMRVAVRHELVPLLEERLGRAIRPTLTRTASLLRDDATFLERLAADAAADILVPDDEGRTLRAAALAGAPRPVAARIVRRALLEAGVVPEASHVASVLDLATGRPGSHVELPGGLLARRDRRYVRLTRPSPAG